MTQYNGDGWICLRGAKAICDAVGENYKDMKQLVQKHGLPAWKRNDRGTWKALPEDLKRWVRDQRDRSMPKDKAALSSSSPDGIV